MRFTDVKDPQRGNTHKQWWFDYPGGTFLSSRARSKPYYKYLDSPTEGRHKRWHRIYDVAVQPDEQLVQYIQKGRGRGWTLWKVVNDDVLERLEGHAGSPPWMVAYAQAHKSVVPRNISGGHRP